MEAKSEGDRRMKRDGGEGYEKVNIVEANERMEAAKGERSLKQNVDTRWYALNLQAESVRSLRFVHISNSINELLLT